MDSRPKVVALGGGHGLAVTLSALRKVTIAGSRLDLTGVVTVADDGGSSGRLRTEFGILPPGDLRMALAALCRDDQWGQTWSEVLQHRFGGTGDLAGHSLGNLLIAALWETHGTVEGLDWVARLLGAQGRVLPMAAVPLDIEAEIQLGDGSSQATVTVVRGQVAVATAAGQVVAVRLVPAAPPACPESVQAILEADVVVLGPGSWFSSVIPHLLVPELRVALAETSARLVVVLNLGSQPGETEGFTAEQHLDVLLEHAPDLHIDVLVADPAALDGLDSVARWCAQEQTDLTLRTVEVGDGTPRHDPDRLAAAFTEILGRGRIGPWR